MLLRLSRIGYRFARRIVIAVIGGTVVLAGVVLLVLPGPAVVVIPLGLAILAMEFAWARHWLHRLKANLSPEQLNGYVARVRRWGSNRSPPPP